MAKYVSDDQLILQTQRMVEQIDSLVKQFGKGNPEMHLQDITISVGWLQEIMGDARMDKVKGMVMDVLMNAFIIANEQGMVTDEYFNEVKEATLQIADVIDQSGPRITAAYDQMLAKARDAENGG